MSNKKYKSTDFYRSLTLQDNLLHENMNLLHDCRSFSDLKPWYRSLSRASTTRYTCDLYSSSGSLGGCLSTYDSLNWMDPFHSLKFEKRYRAADHLVILKPWPAAGHLDRAIKFISTTNSRNWLRITWASSRSDVTTLLCPDPYLRGRGPFRTWLKRGIKNRGFDQIKKCFRRNDHKSMKIIFSGLGAL